MRVLRRLRPFTIVAILAALAVGALGAVAARFLWVSDLEEELVREANRTIGAQHPRPLHVDVAAPGSFADALARHLPPLEGEARRWFDRKDLLEHLRAAGAGTEPLEALPPEYAETLAAVRTDLRGLLEGTHAARAELAVGSDPFMPAGAATWSGYQFAARLVAVEVRSALAAGKRDEAVELCLDGLALGRDAAVAGGLIGRMVHGATATILLPACAATLGTSAAPREVQARLRSVRDAVPAFESTVREESAAMQLLMFGQQLSAEHRAQLRPRPAALATSEEPARWLGALTRRIAWRDIARSYAELAEAIALRGDARRSALSSFDQRWSSTWNPGMKPFATNGPDFLRYALRDEAAVLRLDLLVCAGAAKVYQTAAAAWPARLDDLVRAGLLRGDEAERLRDVALVPEPGGALTLRLLLPELEGSERETVSVRLER